SAAPRPRASRPSGSSAPASPWRTGPSMISLLTSGITMPTAMPAVAATQISASARRCGRRYDLRRHSELDSTTLLTDAGPPGGGLPCRLPPEYYRPPTLRDRSIAVCIARKVHKAPYGVRAAPLAPGAGAAPRARLPPFRPARRAGGRAVRRGPGYGTPRLAGRGGGAVPAVARRPGTSPGPR